jgi:hypothetical protein
MALSDQLTELAARAKEAEDRSQGGTRITSIEPVSVCQNMGAASSRAG